MQSPGNKNMSDGPAYVGGSPFRPTDDNLLASDEDDCDDRGIPDRSPRVPEIRNEEASALCDGANQTNGPESLVKNHESSIASRSDADIGWSWPNVGYSSLKQWASANNMTSFPPMHNISTSKATAVPYKDSLLNSYTHSVPLGTDIASNKGGGQSALKNDDSFGHFSNDIYARNKRSSSVGQKSGRSEMSCAGVVGPPEQGPDVGDVLDDEKSVVEDGGCKAIKEEEETEINDTDHLSCHVCSFVGLKEEDFREHMAIHFRQRCPLCDYTCRTAGRLRRHTKEFHHDLSPTSTSTTLATAEVVVSAASSLGAVVRDAGLRKNYQCRHCDYSTVERDNYWEHKLVHIPIARQLRCPYDCKFVTDLKHHLVYHLLNHSGTKPYHCDRCSYECINKSMLNSHMKSHSNYYPYRCFHCSFASKYPHPMKVHERKRGHKRMQLNPGSKKVALNCTTTDFASGTPDVKSESKATIVELISPIENSQVPSKKRNHKKIEHPSSSKFQSQPQSPPMPSNLLQSYPQFPMGFMPTGGYYLPGYIPTNGWMFSPFATRFPIVGGGGLPPINGMNESWLAQKALPSSQDNSQRKSNLSIRTSPTKSVGRDNSNSVQINLLQSMNLFQSNVMFNFAHNYVGSGCGGDRGGGQMFTQQPLKCSLCYFVATTAVGLLQHTMIVHTTTSLSNNASARSSFSRDFFETGGRPILQSTPVKHPKLSENAATRMTDSHNGDVSNKGKATPERKFVESNAMFPRVNTLASYEQTRYEEYDRNLTSEITASIDRECKKRNDQVHDFKRNENLTNFASSAKRGLKQECVENGDSKEHDVPILSTRHQSRLSSASPDDITTGSYTPIKQRFDSASRLDLISTRLQSRQVQGSGSSQGYHTSNLSGSSTKETSANSATSWPIGSPVSPLETGTPKNERRSGYGKFVQPAHSSSGCKPRRILAEDTNVDEPEDLSVMGGRGRVKDLTRTPPSSSPLNPSAIRCLNEQFSVADGSIDVAKHRISKSVIITPRQSSPPPLPLHDTRIGQYPHECCHCKLMFSDYSMYSAHMAYHGRDDPFKCNRCGKFSDNEVDFYNHIGTTGH